METRTRTLRAKLFSAVFTLSLVASGGAGADETDGSAEPEAFFAPTVENGDIDASGTINITDVLKLVNWLYLDGPEPMAAGCERADGVPSEATDPEALPDIFNGDIDGDGNATVTDVLRLVNYLYLDGVPPAPISCVEVSEEAGEEITPVTEEGPDQETTAATED